MKKTLLFFLIITLTTFEALACSCSWSWNDSFSRTARNNNLVALAKVISFDSCLTKEIHGFDGDMPYAMTVELIEIYKGNESRKKVQIIGDDGMWCRPYLSEFQINQYYLIAPILRRNQYEFFFCRTDYLKVNIEAKTASGKYSLIRNKINLSTFQKELKYGFSDLSLIYVLIALLIFFAIIIFRNKKRNTNEVNSP